MTDKRAEHIKQGDEWWEPAFAPPIWARARVRALKDARRTFDPQIVIVYCQDVASGTKRELELYRENKREMLVLSTEREELDPLDPADPEPVTAFCPFCDTENPPIGALGPRNHYCCRQCGVWYSPELEND